MIKTALNKLLSKSITEKKLELIKLNKLKKIKKQLDKSNYNICSGCNRVRDGMPCILKILSYTKYKGLYIYEAENNNLDNILPCMSYFDDHTNRRIIIITNIDINKYIKNDVVNMNVIHKLIL